MVRTRQLRLWPSLGQARQAGQEAGAAQWLRLTCRMHPGACRDCCHRSWVGGRVVWGGAGWAGERVFAGVCQVFCMFVRARVRANPPCV